MIGKESMEKGERNTRGAEQIESVHQFVVGGPRFN